MNAAVPRLPREALAHPWLQPDLANRSLHQVARMRLDHQPHFPSRGELQRIACGESKVNFHLDSALHARGNDHIALLE